MRPFILTVLSMLCLFSSPLYAAQSTIVEAEGSACMGDDKSRRQTEQAALLDAKRQAVEHAGTYIKSESEVKNFVLEKDLLAAYANAEVKIVKELAKEWHKDLNSGDCLKLRIQAEVIPDTLDLEKMARQSPAMADDQSAPLMVKAWTDKKGYKQGDRIKVFIKGNKPFYARVIYKDASGGMIQLLPNPYRTENYFNGGTIYEIPSGNDRFELEVSPPFGEENIIVYGSTAPLGEIAAAAEGGVYQVKTAESDVEMKTRGVKITAAKDVAASQRAAEFSGETVRVTTGK